MISAARVQEIAALCQCVATQQVFGYSMMCFLCTGPVGVEEATRMLQHRDSMPVNAVKP